MHMSSALTAAVPPSSHFSVSITYLLHKVNILLYFIHFIRFIALIDDARTVLYTGTI